MKRLCVLTGLLLTAVPASLFAQPFTFTFVEQDMDAVRSGNAIWGDYDGDGDLDILLTGASDGGLVAKIYRNNGIPESQSPRVPTADFEDIEAGLTPVNYSGSAWGDYDGDGDLDLVLTGSATRSVPYAPISRLYRNDNGTFVEIADAALEGLHSGSAAWGDYDNDGDLDLLINGTASSNYPYDPITRLYRNDEGSFSDTETDLVGITFGMSAWGDYDNDGDLDILVSGLSRSGFSTRIYRNSSEGFTDIQAELPAVAFSSVDWGDYDNDGDLDLMVTGGQPSVFVVNGATTVYRNDGSDRFVLQDLGLAGMVAGTGQWGDYDGDGDLDALLIGAEHPFGSFSARVYRNEDSGFIERIRLPGLIFSSATWGDYDNDGDLDLITLGMSSSLRTQGSNEDRERLSVTNLYRNDRTPSDVVPAAPRAGMAEVEADRVTLQWEAPVDERSASRGLTYNLKIGSEPGGNDVLSAQSDPGTGYRRLMEAGNVQLNTEWSLSHLPQGTYYWSVQSVNPSFIGSPFVDGGSFTIKQTSVSTETDIPGTLALHPNYPNPFTSETVIRYELPLATSVRLTVYNVLGEKVQVLVRADQPAGVHNVVWDGMSLGGKRVGSGVYFYELRIHDAVLSGKMMHIE